jgi:hypothetical protein
MRFLPRPRLLTRQEGKCLSVCVKRKQKIEKIFTEFEKNSKIN